MKNPSLSIVLSIGKLPKYNFLRLFEVCLHLLDRQSLSKRYWELIVSDYGSTSPSYVRELLEKKRQIQSRHIYTSSRLAPVWNNAKCKNIGVVQAKGNFLLLMNPDTWLSRGALACALENAKMEREPFLYLGLKYDLSRSFTGRVLSEELNVDSVVGKPKIFKKHLKSHPGAKGDFQLMLRETYSALDGYDERFWGRGGDDYDFCDRFRKKFGTRTQWLTGSSFFIVHPHHKKSLVNNSANLRLLRDKRVGRVI